LSRVGYLAVVLGLGLLGFACGPAASDPAQQADERPPRAALPAGSGEGAGWYEQAMAATTEADLRAAIPYARIELEHVGSALGSWPSYSVMLARDGRAEYSGNERAARTGRHVGVVEPVAYARLCLLLEQAGFFEMDARYETHWSCEPTDQLRVWRAEDSPPTVVEDRGSAGPLSLWGLRAAVEGVAANLAWEASG